MAELAGFDAIIELSSRTLTDAINAKVIAKDPDGNDIHLFGGPFVIDASLPFAGSSALVRLIAEAYFQPMPQSATTRVEIDLRDCSIQIGNAGANAINGTATLSLPAPAMVRALPTISGPSPTVDDWNPSIPFNQAAINVALDSASHATIDTNLGAGRATILERALEAFLQTILSPVDGRIDLTFRIKPGQDSDAPGQLSAAPEFRWIDAVTLGIFCYYRAAASGGSAQTKADSNIVSQPGDWVADDAPAAIGRIPAERFAVFLSAAGFDLVIGRPAVRSVIRKLVREKAADEQRPRAEQQRAQIELTVRGHRNQYIDEERAGHNNTGPATQQEAEAADQRIKREVNAEIEALRWRLADDYLDRSEGLQRLESETPYSAGAGSYVQPVPMPDPLPATTAYLHYLTLLLEANRIRIVAKARAALPEILGVSCGDLDAQVSAQVSLGYFGRTIVPTLTKELPEVHYDANPVCQVAASAVAYSITGPVGGTILTLTMDPIIETFAAIAIDKKVGQKLGGLEALSIPMPAQVKEIVDIPITPQSFGIVALLPWRFERNSFQPGVRIEVTRESYRPSSAPEKRGRYAFPATRWGCPAQTFDYVERFWDSVWVASVVDRAIPLPLKIVAWYAQFGSPTMNSIAGMSVVDPRPHYYGALPMPLNAPALSGAASVWLESPPPSGRVETRPALRVAVKGVTGGKSWRLSANGIDGNFFVRLWVEVQDGNGKPYAAEATIPFWGDQVVFSSEYDEAMKECDEKHRFWIALQPPTEVIRHVPKSEQVQRQDWTQQAINIARRLDAGDPAVLPELRRQLTRHGIDFAEEVQRHRFQRP